MEDLSKAKIPAQILGALSRIRSHGKAYLVGGCVRDMLRGVQPKDYDVTTDLLPEKVMALGWDRVIPTGLKHLTVTVVVGESKTPIEITTFRGEGPYTDGRRPDSVVPVSTLEADLARRDFSIGAMGYDPFDNTLIDPFGGQQDLKAKRIKAVGDPLTRFNEDGLRCLRAIRFFTTFDDFSIEFATYEAIPKALPVYEKVAIERVMDELRKILSASRPSIGLLLMRDTGLLKRIQPGYSKVGPGVAKLDFEAIDRLPVYLRLPALLILGLAPATEQQIDTLKLPGIELKRIQLLRAHLNPWLVPERTPLLGIEHAPQDRIWTDAGARKLLAKVGPENVDDIMWMHRSALATCLHRSFADTEYGKLKAHMDQVRAKNFPLKFSDLAISGDDLIKISGKKGPAIGNTLHKLMDLVLENPECNTQETLTKTATAMMAESTPSTSSSFVQCNQ